MKNRLLTLAGGLAMLGVLGHFYAKPLLAQVRAALVSSIDEPGRIPYTAVLSPFVTAGGSTGFSAPTVPSNKRLVITFVSAAFNGANPGTTPVYFLNFLAGQSLRGYVLLPGGQVSQSAQIYFNGGETPFVVSTFAPLFGAQLVLSGYLLDCSAAACSPMAP
jgi:hypothetical protein